MRRLFIYLILIVAAFAPTAVAVEALATGPASTAPKADVR
jgi:hypothetical protein